MFLKDPLLIKKCITCGKEIEIRLKRDIERKKYCSRSCAYKDYHKKNPELLKNLDKGRTPEVRKKAGKIISERMALGEIPKPPIKKYSSVSNARKKYCKVCNKEISSCSTSNLCKLHFNKAKRTKIKIKCSNCGKETEKIPYNINENNHNFCSRNCAYEYRKKQPNKKIKAVCKNCDKIFYKYPSLLNGKNTFCCSVCSSIYYGKKNRKKCFFYIDGRTPLRKLIKNGSYYDNWRLKALEKGRNKCEICGETSKLHIHHKNKFSKLYDEFLFKYNNLSPEKDIDKLLELSKSHKPFWDVNNGQVLCVECHAKKHPDVFFLREVV